MLKILVSVAWPYCNGDMHIGHIRGAYLPSDIFARYHRLAGNDVLMVSGSDTHGTPITVRAEEEGISPREGGRSLYHPRNVQMMQQFGDQLRPVHRDRHGEPLGRRRRPFPPAPGEEGVTVRRCLFGSTASTAASGWPTATSRACALRVDGAATSVTTAAARTMPSNITALQVLQPPPTSRCGDRAFLPGPCRAEPTAARLGQRWGKGR